MNAPIMYNLTGIVLQYYIVDNFYHILTVDLFQK